MRLPVRGEQVSRCRPYAGTRLTLGRGEVEEIAEELGIEPEKVIDLIGYSRDRISLDAPGEDETSLGDLIARGRHLVLTGCVESRGRDRLDSMFEALDARSADVVRRRYGLADGRQAKRRTSGGVGHHRRRVRQIERAAAGPAGKEHGAGLIRPAPH